MKKIIKKLRKLQNLLKFPAFLVEMEARKKVLNQAEMMFMRYGIKSVTMDDIARDLGMSKKTLYQFVSNKADLIQQIFAKLIESEKEAIHSIVENAGNAVEEILNIGKYILQQLRSISPRTLYDLHKYYRDSWELIQALHQKHVYFVIKNNLDRGIEEGLYRSDIDSDIVAKLYIGKTSSVVDEDLFPLRKYNKETLFKEFIKYHLHGVASQKGLKLLDKYSGK
ncbi:MAG: TetR/AcrR family transcriptional regulator [Bacteroidota bacterium]